MFRLEYSQPSEIQGTIKTERPIRYHGLGDYEDIYGNRWNVRAIYGKVVCACPIYQLHPYFHDTSGVAFGGFIQQTWKPYLNEVMEWGDFPEVEREKI